MNIPRCEHPKPQFERAEWLNLNGLWAFEIDNGRSGVARKMNEADYKLSGEITVPFCPQSKLSGVEHKDFMYGVWYQKKVVLTKEQLKKRIVLHIGAADYETTIYINGKKAGYHKGGYVSFCFDITKFVVEGENTITVNCIDDERDRLIPRGKQCEQYLSIGCDYTRTTGIWQTVWLEFTPKSAYIEKVKYYPDINTCTLTIQASLKGEGTFKAVASYEGKAMGEIEITAKGGLITANIPLKEKHLWEVGNGRLYDLELTYGEDSVKSYFGLRNVRLDGMKFLINEKSVFQRLVLDQGFYPDGIYTAPTAEALEKDIELSMAVGFNGARLHQKIFEERFLYYCDKKGYIVWGEYPDWGLDHTYADNIYGILPEWEEEVERDFNHPAIIGWCPHNETWDKKGRKQFDDAIRLIYRTTKAMDNTRPCIDTSGNYHVETDIFDVHDYEQNPEIFKEHYDKLMTENILHDRFEKIQHYEGQPTFVSEYGGIGWSEKAAARKGSDLQNDWGYGVPSSEEEFISRFKGLTDALLDNDKMFALCYTQLTDVEQEKNGLYTYERKPKFDQKIFYDILTRKAAIED